MTLPGVDRTATDDYRARLQEHLERRDDRVTDVYDAWVEYVETHHGSVFEGDVGGGSDGGGRGDSDTEGAAGVSPRQLFVDTLTFDAAVSSLRQTVEATLNVGVDTPTDPLDLSSVHDAVGEVDTPDDTASLESLVAVDVDDIGRLYERTVSPATRRVFGEYYTPRGMAALGVEAAADALDDFGRATVLDPGCGAGVFLTAALRHKQAEVSGPNSKVLDRLTSTVVGIDVNPVAVAAARTAYLLTLVPLVADSGCDRISVPVYLGDALGVTATTPKTGLEGRTAALVGNPPWIPWDRLPEAQKRRLRDGPIQRLGLFDHHGARARLGHANDDLSLPFVWTCLDTFLEDDGVATFVLKRDHLRGPSGRLLRSGRVGDRTLRVTHVHDFADVDPFDGVDAAAALYCFRVGSDSNQPLSSPGERPPVPMTVWERTSRRPDFTSRAGLYESLHRTETTLVPVDADETGGAWRRADADSDALGECTFHIRHGLKDDAKAVFSVDESLLEELEPTHVYPYLRSKHVVKWGLFGYDRFLVPQSKAGEENEARLRRETPATHEYLSRNRDRLLARRSSWFDAGPFYSLFGLGPYTWAPYKVVWCRLGFKPHFSVVSTVEDPVLGEKTVVPGDHCMFVPCDSAAEAHYLCALLNAAPYQRCLRDIAGEGKSSLSKSVVSSLALPAWEATPRQTRLSQLSREAHDVVPGYTDRSKRAYNQLTIPELARIEASVDAVASRFLGSL